MSIHLHELKGCSPTPLAKYLKSLGILRLVGEQKDPAARGWWESERFYLMTTLAKEPLEEFFLNEYRPTPIFNPWGGRSGYYAGLSRKKTDPEKTAGIALKLIEHSSNDRLASFRKAITMIRSVIQRGGGLKPEDDASRATMVSRLRSELRDAGSDWLATVLADLGDSNKGPAIFGTGGNEGSGSYTAAFLAAVVECVGRRAWNEYVATSLWSDSANRDAWSGSFQPPTKEGDKKPKVESIAAPFRQFLPSGDGSPWDLLFAFEGAVIVQSGVVRRSSVDQHKFLSSPFYFMPLGMGSPSSSEQDEVAMNKGKKNPGRGEQWFPLWGAPSTLAEVRHLFREGRCSTGRRTAKNPLDAARAICGLGTSRGISAFFRYGYLQRDNLATHFAVPLGRIKVREDSTARLVDDLLGWLDRLHYLARKKNAPNRLIHAERRLADAVFAALTHDHTAERWQAILLAAVDIESIQASGTAIEAQPIPKELRPEWIAAVDDGSAEVRLALALGSAFAEYRRDRQPIDPIRHHWLPLEPGARKFKMSDKRLVNDPRVVATGRDPIRDLAAIVERRLIEATMDGKRRSRLRAVPGCAARLSDIAAFLAGQLDIDLIVGLARAFMAIKWPKSGWTPANFTVTATSERTQTADEAWLALRLCVLPFRLDESRDMPADERIVRLLMAGNVEQAIEIARRRLIAVGIRPPFDAGTANADIARLWAAAMAFPISQNTARHIAGRLDPRLKPQKGLTHV